MKHVLNTIALMTVAVVLTGLIAGCGGKAGETVAQKVVEKAIEAGAGDEAGKVDVDITEDTFSMKVQDEGVELALGEEVAVPENFPKDVPIYPGAKVMGVVSATADQTFSVQAKTADSLEKVADYYQKELAQKGWKEEMTMSQPELRMLTCSKDGRTVSAMVTKEGDGAAIMLTVGTG